MIAASGGHATVTALLLQHGAQINWQDEVRTNRLIVPNHTFVSCGIAMVDFFDSLEMHTDYK